MNGMQTFNVLADPTRRSIVEMLANEGLLSAGDITRRFAVSGPAISQHLKILREAHLVKVRKQAQHRLYDLNPAGFQPLEAWLFDLRSMWNERFDALEAVLQENEPKESRRQHQPRRKRDAELEK